MLGLGTVRMGSLATMAHQAPAEWDRGAAFGIAAPAMLSARQARFSTASSSDRDLKKTADLAPFCYDPDWTQLTTSSRMSSQHCRSQMTHLRRAGSDFLHGGSGDDAISGAEALPDASVPIRQRRQPNGV